MSSLRHRIEAWFESLGRLICRFRWIFAIGLLVFAALLISRIPSITIDTSNEGFFHQDDPYVTDYYDFRDQFGREIRAHAVLKIGQHGHVDGCAAHGAARPRRGTDRSASVSLSTRMGFAI